MAPPTTRSSSRNNTEAPEHPTQIGSESGTLPQIEEQRETQIQEDSPEQRNESLEGNTRLVNETIRNLEAQAAEYEARAALQERLLAAQKLVAENEEKLRAYKKPTGRSRIDRGSSSESEQSQKGEIKRDVGKFEEDFGIKHREDWLNDLDALFKGAPKKYISGTQKILAATNYLCTTHKGKWVIHERKHPEDASNWEAFREWTKTLLRNSHNIVTDILIKFQEATMKPLQDPRNFETYLESLENHLPKQGEEQRAQTLFMKLWKPLRDVMITTSNGTLPTTRDEMSKLASTLYHVHFANQKRKEFHPQHQDKRRRGNHHDSTSDHPRTDTQRGRGRGQPRGRGQFRGRARGRGFSTYRGRSRNSANTTAPTEKGNGTASAPEGACFICQDKNHWANECPQQAQYPLIGTAVRLHVPITLWNGSETHADLDTGAECDVVSKEFAYKNGLLAAPFSSPSIKGVAPDRLRTHGVFWVLFTIRDSRGIEKTAKRACIGIDRDSRLEGSPILLSRTFINEFDVILRPSVDKWWFGVKSFELQNPHKFAKQSRNAAVIYALIKMPEEVWLPDENIGASKLDRDRIPPELEAYLDVFDHEKSGTLPRTKVSDHAIELEEGKAPPFGPIYPLSRTELRELWAYLVDNIKKGRIRPSKSPAGAPILFVPKKDGGLRLCVDYRGLNRVSVKNRYPLPLISEILDRLSGAKCFSKVDVKDAYYRIRLREGDEWKTAFRTRYGHFEYIVMPFGLSNAPATFQSYIHIALAGLVDVICVAYLDDILVFTKDRESHTTALRQIFERLRRAELYVKPSKCTFYQKEVEFLGFIVDGSGVKMDRSRIRVIQEWEEPKSYHDVQVFLGFCNFYRRFIQGYSHISLPLTSMMKGSKNGKKPGQVKLNDTESAAFRRLKQAFQSASLLYHFDPEKHIRLETDASNQGMGGVLSQPDDKGRWHPVAFWSRKFSGPELNYATPDQELFAIVHSFQHWRHYLDGSKYPIEVLSDHANLRTFMTQQKLNGRQARWCMFLTPFDFIIKHRLGKTNPADGLSRIPNSERAIVGEELTTPIHERIVGDQPPDLKEAEEGTALNIQRILEAKDLDADHEYDSDEHNSEFQPGFGQRTPQGNPGSSAPIETIVKRARTDADNWSEWRELCDELDIPFDFTDTESAVIQSISTDTIDILDQVGKLQLDDPETNRRKGDVSFSKPGSKGWSVDASGLLRYRGRLYVPKKQGLRIKLMQMHHDDPTAGHFGRARTEELLRRKYHWVNLQADVQKHVKSCAICQTAQTPRHRPFGKLESLPIPPRPFAELSMDFITGLPQSIWKGKIVDAILVIVDRFSKWCLFSPVSTTMDASELAELFYHNVELRFGPPNGIVSDRGSVFTSRFWSKLCYMSQVKLRYSTAFHPQTDGQTERMNQTLEHYLRCFIDEQQKMWPTLLRIAEFACNNAVNATIGMSPFQALLGYNPNFQIRAEDGSVKREAPAALSRIEKLSELREKL
ncbi:hypothetical protein PENFLA_c027G03970 [Penicillium flavigenum]|uniref:Reverse transcriptase n=1 Tax=Penicillium flavigenum TaxID=254877 RepID=A0A1V6SR88_9EURO|nr:hypothetical protein PENFLA_c027G03970 [Penicillium flavigenum]